MDRTRCRLGQRQGEGACSCAGRCSPRTSSTSSTTIKRARSRRAAVPLCLRHRGGGCGDADDGPGRHDPAAARDPAADGHRPVHRLLGPDHVPAVCVGGDADRWPDRRRLRQDARLGDLVVPARPGVGARRRCDQHRSVDRSTSRPGVRLRRDPLVVRRDPRPPPGGQGPECHRVHLGAAVGRLRRVHRRHRPHRRVVRLRLGVHAARVGGDARRHCNGRVRPRVGDRVEGIRAAACRRFSCPGGWWRCFSV